MSTVNRSGESHSRPKITSPTKQSQSSWLFNHRPDLDVENKSLLNGSAPESEYFNPKTSRNSNFNSTRNPYEARTSSLNSIENGSFFSTTNSQRFSTNSVQTKPSSAAPTAMNGLGNTHLAGWSINSRDPTEPASTTRNATTRAFERSTYSRDGSVTISPTQTRFNQPKFDMSINAGGTGPRTPDEDVDFSLSSLTLSQKPAPVSHPYSAPSFTDEQSSLTNGHPCNINRQQVDPRYAANGAATSFEPSHVYTPSGNFPSMWTYAEQEAISPYANDYQEQLRKSLLFSHSYPSNRS